MRANCRSIPDLLNSGKACFAAILLFSLLQLCPFRLMWQVGGDDLSYLSHAFTMGLDFDLDYANEPATRKSANGRVASHPMGPGLMAAPFVALFSTVDRLGDHPVISNHAMYSGSWSYFGFLFSTVFYYFSGIMLYYRAMVQIRPLPATTAFLLLASSGAAYFAMNRFTLGHSFEFFLLAVIFWGMVRLWCRRPEQEGGGSSRSQIVPCFFSAAAIVLSLLVRPANLNVVLLPPLLLSALLASGDRVDWRFFRKSLLQLYFWTLLFAIPFSLFNHAMYGVLYPTVSALYQKSAALARYGIDPDHSGRTAVTLVIQVVASLKYLPNLLFSSEHGLLYSNPLTVVGSLLLLMQLCKSTAMRLLPRVTLLTLVLGYCALPVAIVLLWKTTAGSYGYRYLFSIFPVALLGYCLWLKSSDPLSRAALYLNRGLVALCLFSVLSQIFFSMTQKLEVREGTNAFGVLYKASANGYDIALAGELAHPRAWLLMLAKKTPGFVAFNLVQLAGFDPTGVAANGGIGDDYRRAVSRMKDSQHGTLVFSPGSYLLQLLVLFAYIACAAIYYGRIRRESWGASGG